jgi:hypothetical protein
MVKILFSDIDGTLIEDNQLLHHKNIEFMNKWREKGNLICLCTGRNIYECQQAINEFHLPYDYLILNNGGHILKENQTLIEKKIDHQTGCTILDELIEDKQLCLYYCDGNHSYSYKNGITYDQIEMNDKEIDKDFKELYDSANDFQIICFHDINKQIEQAFNHYHSIINKFSDKVSIHINQFYFDIVPNHCSKGEGIKELLSLIKVDTSLSVGDSYNDISMYENTDVSCSFHYSDDEVKNKSTKVVSYVYELLEEYL